VTKLRFPPEFRPLDDGSRFADQFLDYMEERGYRPPQIKWLIETFDLHYALRGKFQYRIIIPVYDRWRTLLTWTARTILPDEELRYRSLKHDQQLCAPKSTLLGLPLLWECPNPRVLMICEGQFDAFRVNVLGRAIGVYATCLFGLSMLPPQMQLLMELKQRFPRMVLLLDADAKFQTFRMAQSGLGLEVLRLPDDEDPDSMPINRLLDLLLSVRNEVASPA
jgi:hypothetical protein